jgi:23S rRNA (uracil1939-C5)-methyltransferase
MLEQLQDFGRAVQGKISSILLEEDAQGIIAVLKSPYDLANAEIQDVLKNAKKYFKNVLILVGEREIGGYGRQILELALNERQTFSLHVPAGSFSQVNWGINLQLIENVLELSQVSFQAAVLDLYAGAGNFSVPLARQGANVTAVEADKRLASFARENASRASLSKRLNVEEISVEKFLKRKPRIETDLIIADPPRSGLGPLVSELSSAKRLMLVSCYLPSFVRDLKVLEKLGWKTEKIIPFDMFPQTSYVEILGVLNKK